MPPHVPPRAGGRPSAYGHWCGTVNNPTVDDLKALWLFNEKNHGPVPDFHELGAVVIGWEHWQPGQGTPHLQIYLELKSTRVRLNQLRVWFPKWHWEPRRGAPLEAADYCRKDGTYRQRGRFSYEPDPVLRRDEYDRQQWWRNLIERIQEKDAFFEVCSDPDLCRYIVNKMQWAFKVWESRPRGIPNIDLGASGFRWQKRFTCFLDHVPTDDRKVTYVFDPAGGKGKSKFVKWAAAARGVMVACANDRKNNSSMYWGQKVVLIDVPRDEALDYVTLEKLKDGLLVQTKYETTLKSYDSPHLIAFSNKEPQIHRLSADRWNIIRDLGDHMTLHALFPATHFPHVVNLKDPFADEGQAFGNYLGDDRDGGVGGRHADGPHRPLGPHPLPGGPARGLRRSLQHLDVEPPPPATRARGPITVVLDDGDPSDGRPGSSDDHLSGLDGRPGSSSDHMYASVSEDAPMIL